MANKLRLLLPGATKSVGRGKVVNAAFSKAFERSTQSLPKLLAQTIRTAATQEIAYNHN
jgi:hypothetical protein